MVFFLCSDPPPPVMESGGLLPLLRSAAAGESWESGEEWGEGAVRGGEANNCRCFKKQRGFSRAAARVQPRPPTCTARAWPWRNCRFVRSQGARPRSALRFVPCGPNSESRQPISPFSSRASQAGPHAGYQTRPSCSRCTYEPCILSLVAGWGSRLCSCVNCQQFDWPFWLME